MTGPTANLRGNLVLMLYTFRQIGTGMGGTLLPITFYMQWT